MFNIFSCDFFVEYGNYYFTKYSTKIYIYIYIYWLTIKRKQTIANIICLWSTQENTCIQIDYFTVKYCKTETLLEININSKLKFHVHVGNLNAPVKTNYMGLPKNCIFMNGFLTIQFNYYRAIQMFHSCSLDNKINDFFKRCQKIIHNYELSNFEEVLNKNNSVSNHHKIYTHWLFKFKNLLMVFPQK